MDKPMLLELSVSLILNNDDLGFYIGSLHLAPDPMREVVESRTYLIKIWFIMFQVTLYG